MRRATTLISMLVGALLSLALVVGMVASGPVASGDGRLTRQLAARSTKLRTRRWTSGLSGAARAIRISSSVSAGGK